MDRVIQINATKFSKSYVWPYVLNKTKITLIVTNKCGVTIITATLLDTYVVTYTYVSLKTLNTIT